ncbi:MAG: hypothetical protein AB7V46_04170 [Thermomicrobiales bacterium]
MKHARRTIHAVATALLAVSVLFSQEASAKRLNELQVYCHANSGPKHDPLWPRVAKQGSKNSDDFSYSIFRAFLKDPALTMPQKLKVSTRRHTIIEAAKQMYKKINKKSSDEDIALAGQDLLMLVGNISGNPAQVIFFK